MSRIVSIAFQFTFTTFVHLLCCWLPLLAAIFNGVALGWLVQYRTPLIIIQMLVLGWSFYDIYGKTGNAHRQSEKVVLWIITGFTILLNIVPHNFFQAEESRLAQAQVERYRSTRVAEFEFEQKIVSPSKLNSTLQSVAGVVPSQIDINDRTLRVRYRLEKTSKPAILAVLRQNGYALELKTNQ